MWRNKRTFDAKIIFHEGYNHVHRKEGENHNISVFRGKGRIDTHDFIHIEYNGFLIIGNSLSVCSIYFSDETFFSSTDEFKLLVSYSFF